MDEFVIEWIRGDTMAAITAPNSSRLKGRLLKLVEEHPDECDVRINRDGSVFGHVPIKYVKLHAPRELSDEARAAKSERMRAFRESQLLSASEVSKIDSNDPVEDFID